MFGIKFVLYYFLELKLGEIKIIKLRFVNFLEIR